MENPLRRVFRLPHAKTLSFLITNPFHLSLRLHKLQSKYQDLHSVSINMQYRITLELEITDKDIILVNIGDHADVYH